jgi:signal transduction histidine kinase/CheY-like chemotaxis protein
MLPGLREWKKSERLALKLCLITTAISIGVVLGWVLDVKFLKSVVTGFVAMKFNTALGLLLFSACQLGLVLDQKFQVKRVKLLAGIFGALAFVIGALTLAEYVFGWNLRIDEFIFIDLDGIGQRYPPGRQAPVTAISFILLGLGVYVEFFRRRPLHRLAQVLFFIVGLISFQALVSYGLGIQTSFGIASHTRIALHTAACLIFLCGGFASLSSDVGFMKIVFSPSQSGQMARRLILASLFVPPLVNLVETVGLKAGYYDSDFGILIRVIGSVVFFVVMVVHNSERLHIAEEKRKEAMAEVVAKEKEGARLQAESEAARIREQSELKLRTELIDARARAENAVKAKAIFLANMSHEIRTPLNGIIGLADLIAETPLNSQQKKYIETLQSSGSSLLSIINDVLDFSKIEAGKMELEKVNFNLASALTTQVSLLGARAIEKGLTLTIAVDSTLPSHVNGDAGRIGQVLLNLIANAIKFTDSGAIQIRAYRSSSGKNKHELEVRFSVTDQGIGLSSESQRKLFQPFVQADGSTSRKYGGTGLGLSICQSLVALMGGQIGLDSQEGQGSTFWFTVPLAAAEVAEPSLKDDAIPAKPLFSPARSLRVLVAEDNVINQMVVLGHLKALGIEGQAVANGQEVLEALKISQFDLILMDCQMPEMDGYQATEKIRLNEKISGLRIPVIALTANAMNEDRDRCLAAGMDAYLLAWLRIVNDNS